MASLNVGMYIGLFCALEAAVVCVPVETGRRREVLGWRKRKPARTGSVSTKHFETGYFFGFLKTQVAHRLSYFIDPETEALRGKVTCLRS